MGLFLLERLAQVCSNIPEDVCASGACSQAQQLWVAGPTLACWGAVSCVCHHDALGNVASLDIMQRALNADHAASATPRHAQPRAQENSQAQQRKTPALRPHPRPAVAATSSRKRARPPGDTHTVTLVAIAAHLL
jgi:hypothetical protein